eukprot:GFUD01033232.1.p1 GENE.GFUD01033232.1~~GFUD01033232.1.p1  ORF type:complete len:308 (-),score=113.65 GFUD01033232.1:61-984(-)
MATCVLHQTTSKWLVQGTKLLTRPPSVHPLARMSHKKEHLDLTSDQYRDPGATPAQIVAIKQLSSTVKGLTLQVATKHAKDVQFQPGQWLDFFIPGEEKVGGFSMCSSPSDLTSRGTLDLAIKYSTWAPAFWVHTQCKVGDVVTFRFGGDFYYPAKGVEGDPSLLLIAGGVGINPLYSIWLQAEHLARSSNSSPTTPYTTPSTTPASVSMLYSAATPAELLFSSNIDKAVQEMEKFSCKYFVTQEGDQTREVTGRICKEDLEKELKMRTGTRTICYLCGPPGMVEQMKGWLEELGVVKEDIKFELWW